MFIIKLLKTPQGRSIVWLSNHLLDQTPWIKFYEKRLLFYRTEAHYYSHNLAIIQQIAFIDGLKPSCYASACYTEYNVQIHSNWYILIYVHYFYSPALSLWIFQD